MPLPWLKWEAILKQEGRVEYPNDYSQLELDGMVIFFKSSIDSISKFVQIIVRFHMN